MTTPSKYVAGFTYTDQQLLALWRECFARISVSGQEYYFGDRKYTAADMPEVRQNIVWLEGRISSVNGRPTEVYAKIHRGRR